MIWRRRWSAFNANSRARHSARCLLALAFFSLTAEVWSNDRPLLLCRGGHLYAPVVRDYPPARFAQTETMVVDYRALALAAGDWAVWPPNRWGPYRTNKHVAEYPAPPSGENWFGTDDRGRDVFARLLYGFRYGIGFALATWAICSALALIYGGACGFLGSWIDLIGQRALEILSTVPQLLLLIFVLSIFEPSLTLLVIVSCAFGWIGLSYLVRGEVMRTRALEHVEASRALGAPRWRIVRDGILPNCLVPLVTLAPFTIVADLTGLAGLDFLGLGLPPPTPSWGELLAEAQTYFNWAWWLALFPSLTLFLTLLWLTFVGEGARAAFDPSALLIEPPASPVRRRRPARRWAWADAVRAAAFSLVLFVGSFAHASAVDVQTQRYLATDPMDMSSTRLNFSGAINRGIVRDYGLGTELNEGLSREVRYHGLKGTGHARLEFAPGTSLTVTSGADRLANEYPQAPASDGGDALVGEDQVIPVYGATLRHARDAWVLQAEVSHDFVYQDWSQPRAAGGLLNGTKYAAGADLHAARGTHLKATAAVNALNDGNAQRTGEFAMMFDLLNRRDRFAAGFGVWYDDLRLKRPSYWTPRDFALSTLRTESHLHFDEDFAVNVKANVGYGGEHLVARDLNYALDAKIEYKLESKWRLSLGCVRMESFNRRGVSTWYRNDLYAGLAAPL